MQPPTTLGPYSPQFLQTFPALALTVMYPGRPSVPGEPGWWSPNKQVLEVPHCPRPSVENMHFGLWVGAVLGGQPHPSMGSVPLGGLTSSTGSGLWLCLSFIHDIGCSGHRPDAQGVFADYESVNEQRKMRRVSVLPKPEAGRRPSGHRRAGQQHGRMPRDSPFSLSICLR